MEAVMETKAAKPPYKMPTVTQGMTVRWYPESDLHAEPFIAFVTKVAYDTLAVTIVHPGAVSLQCMDGVRHRSDPKGQRDETRQSGVWDYIESDTNILRQRIADLEAKVNGLNRK
jgi:hypothetical protein